MKKESIFPLFRGWKLREKVKSCTCFRYAFALCLICMTSLVFAQEKKLSYKWEEKSLSDVLNTLEKVGVYKFVFNYDDVVVLAVRLVAGFVGHVRQRSTDYCSCMFL